MVTFNAGNAFSTRLVIAPKLADIGEEEAIEVEFEPIPETAPATPPTPAPSEPVPA